MGCHMHGYRTIGLGSADAYNSSKVEVDCGAAIEVRGVRFSKPRPALALCPFSRRWIRRHFELDEDALSAGAPHPHLVRHSRCGAGDRFPLDTSGRPRLGLSDPCRYALLQRRRWLAAR